MKNRMPSHRSVGPLLAVFVLALLMAGSRADRLFAGGKPKPQDLQQQCPADCQAMAGAAQTACLQGGGLVADCQAEADALLQVCLQFRCGQGPGGVPVTKPCQTQCAEAAILIFDRCIAIEQLPADVCKARYSAFYAACESRVCSPATATSTATPSCSQQCQESGVTYYDNCVASGVAANICAQQAQAAVAACLASSCATVTVTVTATKTTTITVTTTVTPTQTTTPTPRATATNSATPIDVATSIPDPTLTACLAKCATIALQEYNNCIASGVDEATCRIKQQNALNTCYSNCGAGTPTVVANRTPTGTPVPLSNCKRTCIDDANLFLRQCIATGQLEVACQSEAQARLERCSQNCNEGTAPPRDKPSPTAEPTFGSVGECNATCHATAEAFYKRCLNSGASMAVCQQQASIIENDCFQSRCVVQPSASCLRSCEVVGANIYITCMRDGEARGGGNIPVCAARKRDHLRRCNGGCRGTPYPTASATPRGGATRRP